MTNFLALSLRLARLESIAAPCARTLREIATLRAIIADALAVAS